MGIWSSVLGTLEVQVQGKEKHHHPDSSGLSSRSADVTLVSVATSLQVDAGQRVVDLQSLCKGLNTSPQQFRAGEVGYIPARVDLTDRRPSGLENLTLRSAQVSGQ